eukprot:6209173-Pleurochrysis_carterae.AAC.4
MNWHYPYSAGTAQGTKGQLGRPNVAAIESACRARCVRRIMKSQLGVGIRQVCNGSSADAMVLNRGMCLAAYSRKYKCTARRVRLKGNHCETSSLETRDGLVMGPRAVGH